MIFLADSRWPAHFLSILAITRDHSVLATLCDSSGIVFSTIGPVVFSSSVMISSRPSRSQHALHLKHQAGHVSPSLLKFLTLTSHCVLMRGFCVVMRISSRCHSSPPTHLLQSQLSRGTDSNAQPQVSRYHQENSLSNLAVWYHPLSRDRERASELHLARLLRDFA